MLKYRILLILLCLTAIISACCIGCSKKISGEYTGVRYTDDGDYIQSITIKDNSFIWVHDNTTTTGTCEQTDYGFLATYTAQDKEYSISGISQEDGAFTFQGIWFYKEQDAAESKATEIHDKRQTSADYAILIVLQDIDANTVLSADEFDDYFKIEHIIIDEMPNNAMRYSDFNKDRDCVVKSKLIAGDIVFADELGWIA